MSSSRSGPTAPTAIRITSRFPNTLLRQSSLPPTPGSPATSGDATMRPHSVTKLYYLAWPASTWRAYQTAVHKLTTTVDGVERQATPWPDWAITTVIDTSQMWATVWRAVSCHESQLAAYERLRDLSPEHHRELWGHQSFYRAYSTVNGGRVRETDLFEGIER